MKKSGLVFVALLVLAAGASTGLTLGTMHGNAALMAEAQSTSTTVVFSTLGYNNKYAFTSYEIDGITFTATKGNNKSGNAPKYYTNGEALRFYAGNTLTIAVDEGYLSSVVFGIGKSGDHKSLIEDGAMSNVDCGVLSANSISGFGIEDHAVTIHFNDEATTGNIYIESIEVTVNSSDTEIVEPTKISVSEESVTFDRVGDSKQLYASVLPSDASQAVSWKSANPEIASVDGSGLVTAQAAGSTEITVSAVGYDEVKATIPVVVKETVAKPVDTFILPEMLDENYDRDFKLMTLDSGMILAYRNFYQREYDDRLEISMYKGQGAVANYNGSTPISRITLVPFSSSNMGEPVVSVGDSYSEDGNYAEILSPVVDESTGNWVYEVEGEHAFFKIAAGSDYTNLSGIIIEHGGEDADAAHAWAQGFLNTTAEECEALDVKADTWASLAESYEALSAEAKAIVKYEYPEIEGNIYTTIQKAIERYSYIVGKYGYENFINIELNAYVAPLSIPGETDSTFYIALGSILGGAGLAIAAAVIIKKREAKASK